MKSQLGFLEKGMNCCVHKKSLKEASGELIWFLLQAQIWKTT